MATLKGQTVVVLGGTSGIGYAVALASLKSSADKVIVASSSAEKVSKATQRLKEASGPNSSAEIVGKQLDGADLDAVKAFFEEIGAIDHLVITMLNSKVLGLKHIKEQSLEDARNVFDMYWGILQAAKCAQVKPGGTITFTNGVLLQKPWPGYGVAIGVAGALDGITRGFAVDLAPTRVNAVSPGLVVTELMNFFEPQARDYMMKQAESTLLVKHVGTPEETAEAYLFIMKCGYITGETIHVNGGHCLV